MRAVCPSMQQTSRAPPRSATVYGNPSQEKRRPIAQSNGISVKLPYSSRLFVALLGIHAILVGYSGWMQSPTLNEPGHLVAGIRHWTYADFALYRVNPPLIRSVAALPSILLNVEVDFSGYYEHPGARPVFGIANKFIEMTGWRSITLVRLSRLTLIPFSLLGAWVCFKWARELFGDVAGLMAASLWCFSPMVLGHAAMIAPDAHATSLGLAACYTFWCWLRSPTWRQTVVSGLVLGAAELSKTTMVLFYPLWPFIWLAYRWPERGAMTLSQWRNEMGMLLLRMLIGVYVINLGYLGEGSFTKLEDYRFVSELFGGSHVADANVGNRSVGGWLGEVPIPLPTNYVAGMDVQQRDFEDFDRPSYLRGVYQVNGWWYYYAYVILVKAPLGTLGLFAISLVAWIMDGHSRISKRDLFVLFSPAVTIFVVASAKSGFSHHGRYVLPCFPYVFIWMGGLAIYITTFFQTTFAVGPQLSRIRDLPARRWIGSGLGLLVLCLQCWTIVSSLWVYPHSISYFNELAGGPKRGPSHLLNSNVDWGQDLLFLRQWILAQKPEADMPVHLAFYNHYNPFDLEVDGIQPWPFQRGDPTRVVPAGVYAISVNLLYEFPWPVRARSGHQYFIDSRPMAYLRDQEPIGWAGYSIRIFSADQIRAAYAATREAPL
ncbi:MAG: glycosyltransferase family 39 protein [Planctomycetota bacterium]